MRSNKGMDKCCFFFLNYDYASHSLSLILGLSTAYILLSILLKNILCFILQNISPAHLPDLVIFLDSITIAFEEASKGGPPLSLPIASIETGNAHSLPNLALRF